MKIVTNEELCIGDIQGELLERKPLPIGKTQFDEWAGRIIKASLVDAKEESLRWTLAAILLSLGPIEAFKPDGYFVLALRKAAVQETAHAMMMEMKQAQAKKIEEQKLAEATATSEMKDACGILENKEV